MHRPRGEDVVAWARSQVDELGDGWPFLHGPLFDRNADRFRAALDAMIQLGNNLRWI